MAAMAGCGSLGGNREQISTSPGASLVFPSAVWDKMLKPSHI